MICRLIAPAWLTKESPHLPKVIEGSFTHEEVLVHNSSGYNAYFLPNYPSKYARGVTVSGRDVDTFNFIFIDCDLKDGYYSSKEQFLDTLKAGGILPTTITDSGNGIHAYWAVSDLDAMSYLRLSRRLMRVFHTDEAVGQIYQLMRIPGTINTKNPEEPKLCEILHINEKAVYTCEQLDKLLPQISPEDEDHCVRHYNMTYSIDQPLEVSDILPNRFLYLLKTNSEVQDIWGNPQGDRSTKDYRLGHILLANGFSKEDAMSVLVNAPKALERGPSHRISYASSIVDKIWVETPTLLDLSTSVEELLSSDEDLRGVRFPCHSYVDNTSQGFRLGQVIGLVAGSGVGKTAIALNMFLGFVQNNPDYEHFFIPLEQPAREIADRWRTMTKNDNEMFKKVHVISNYDKDGKFRHLSLEDIKKYLLKFKAVTGKKIGCVVIDHIGALNHRDPNGENQGLMSICHSMKSFAVETNTMLIMQSQAPREKAGVGDLELSKDAAYGTVFFESYCDYLITLWQPLKRAYADGAPTVTAFKFCKIRHKKQHLDAIKEDVCYRLLFDPETEHLREMTLEEDDSFTFFLNKATNMRKSDRKTDLVSYVSTRSLK